MFDLIKFFQNKGFEIVKAYSFLCFIAHNNILRVRCDSEANTIEFAVYNNFSKEPWRTYDWWSYIPKNENQANKLFDLVKLFYNNNDYDKENGKHKLIQY
jgi:hypothetical protein